MPRYHYFDAERLISPSRYCYGVHLSLPCGSPSRRRPLFSPTGSSNGTCDVQVRRRISLGLSVSGGQHPFQYFSAAQGQGGVGGHEEFSYGSFGIYGMHEHLQFVRRIEQVLEWFIRGDDNCHVVSAGQRLRPGAALALVCVNKC